MKKLFVAALLVVGMTAFAQEKEGRKRDRLTSEQKVDLQVKKMTTDLSLNEKQVAQVKDLVTKQVEKREAKRAEVKADKEQARAEMKTKMKEEQAAASADMKKILTPEQYTKWEKMREERNEKMKEKLLERHGKKELK